MKGEILETCSQDRCAVWSSTSEELTESLAPGQMTLYSSFVISAPCAVSPTFFSPFIFFFSHASGMAVWMTMSTTLAQTEISNLLDWLPWRYVQSFLVPKLCILMILPTFSYSKPPYTWSLIMGMTFTASRHLTKSVTLHGNRMLQLVRSINHSWRVNWVNTTNTFIGD